MAASVRMLIMRYGPMFEYDDVELVFSKFWG
jgi:hypothetical protein